MGRPSLFEREGLAVWQALRVLGSVHADRFVGDLKFTASGYRQAAWELADRKIAEGPLDERRQALAARATLQRWAAEIESLLLQIEQEKTPKVPCEGRGVPPRPGAADTGRVVTPTLLPPKSPRSKRLASVAFQSGPVLQELAKGKPPPAQLELGAAPHLSQRLLLPAKGESGQ